MARTREFDEDEVLDQAMVTFWRRGYRATSLEDLLAAMGLSKSSFYESFGSKLDVLLEAMHRYAASGMGGLIEPLLRPDARLAEIEEALERLARHARSSGGQRGCLLNNCLGEVVQHEPRVLETAREILSALETLLVAAVIRGQEAGQITRKESPRALARFLANTFGGINLAAKARPKKEELDDIVRVALSALRPTAAPRRKAS
jgi:TetR/AcrR family transcriptional repressor of nem operon